MTAPERYPAGGYTGLGAFRDRRPPPRLFVLAGALVLIGAAALLVVLHGKNTRAGGTAPADLRPYSVGTCLYEVPGGRGKTVALRETACSAADAVFVVNHTVPRELDCARYGDYAGYGLVQSDSSAGVAYCLSLIVPPGECVHLAAHSAPQRVDCAPRPGVRRVVRIVHSADPRTACAAFDGAAPRYWKSPAAHRIACLLPA